MFKLRTPLLVCAVLACLLGASYVVSPSRADGGANHQTLNNNYGVSGGNVNDSSRRFCCSGTLGSLVKDSAGALYILSNNHVLARASQAAAGEDISQPGLIDNNCAIPRIVADFTTTAALGSNVDAALAALRAGTMNTTGSIEDIGTISGVVKAPAVGLAVAKSGRTTGFTTGTIGSVNTSVNVSYPKSCGSSGGTVVSYTNQVVINSSTFSAGGDSGSLIVSNNSASCRQPVALLFAGSSTSTIGNPINDVLAALSAKLGRTVSFVGGTCTAALSSAATPDLSATFGGQMEVSALAVEHATGVMRAAEHDLMARPGVIGVGIGAAGKGINEATIVIYVDRTAATQPDLPKS
ncbi:MAG TPA: hypothetical protein VE775_00375, partial [Pyrinomonadaceae bacterium]|nr:hypothetical protein [Pyrinomonadaceae bacterium]